MRAIFYSAFPPAGHALPDGASQVSHYINELIKFYENTGIDPEKLRYLQQFRSEE